MKKVWIGMSAMCLFLNACKKESTNPPDNNNNTTDPVSVLKDGSGYAQVFDDLQVLSSANAAPPSMGVMDYTLESNGNLNLAYFSAQPTQQDVLYTNKRVTKNLNSSSAVALPSGADNLQQYSRVALAQQGKTVVLEQFRPYSNFFTYATRTQSGNNSAQFGGDVYCNIAGTPNPIGYPDMGFRFPCMNVSVNTNDNGFGYFASGVPNPTYTLSGTSVVSFTFFNNLGSPVVASFLESDVFTYGNYKAIFVRADSIVAYDVDNQGASFTRLTGVPVSGISGGNNYTTLRHYSTDGKTLGMLITNTNNNHFWTVSYNFTTGVMTKGLEGVTLDYSGTGSDYDVDEFGNIYYTGYAGNGSNTIGVSVYKKSTSGAVSTIGQDDFLKFGTVIKLKVLMGKVYVALTGKKTGTNAYQLSILKQN